MPKDDPRYDLAYHLPQGKGDSFPFHKERTVAEMFWSVYNEAIYKTMQEEGEEVAVIIQLERFPLGPFVLPFQEPTPQMREMTVAEFYELLWKDWREAFRILPANTHSKVDAFLASNAGQ